MKTSTADRDSSIQNFVDELDELLMELASHSYTNTDIEDLISKLDGAVKDNADAEKYAVAISQARSLVERAMGMIKATGAGEPLRRFLQGRTAAIRVALEISLSKFSCQSELDAARIELCEAESKLEKVTEDMERAISGGNIESVTELRAELILNAPRRIVEKQLAVLDLEMEKTLESGSPLRARVTQSTARADQARQTVADATLALRRSIEESDQIAEEERGLQSSLSLLESSIRKLRETHDQLATESKRRETIALRELAGLPPLLDGIEADDARTNVLRMDLRFERTEV